ncbi:MAG: hypothetical protein NTY12_05650 [Candidatus Falkowbacteria bacterium]|nr:hypothetical protein [Candidatus Falkowbacteria bacterium]
MKKMPKVERLIFETYLAMIKNSLGTKMFQNFYLKNKAGEKVDVMRNGEVSCAFYVSSILAILRLIKYAHGRVDITVDDLLKSGWKKIKQAKIGAVVVWHKFDFGDGDPREHIGFYMGDDQAISNNYKKCCPIKHSLYYNGSRKIKAIYWHKNLD